ncbi:Bile acid:sodium symporter [Desulforamulus reducens MI-1]|uniref:Bile acid:sodium symporter n=1 Tax=Desulforamulus reducens (strain ATCC BAA-1160 / DSM 100696 / MI-1) TaxID=349161 RepID=A4J1Q0_DESRM|nr:bile acid:sodium symporter family protein [Desulforamulus reducens]ABO49003.1 Bile acid:sodium symporter [Desulforamulus reducens MI-1]
MLNYFSLWNIWLSRRMFFVVLSALLFGFTFSLPTSKFGNWLATLLFAYMTFVTALDSSLKDFIHILAKPWINIWMLLLIHGIMPLLAFCIGILFYPDNAFIRLGFLIGATIPIGVTSIIWTSLAGGDVALSMVAVTLDTLISPVLLPLFITLVAGRTVNIDVVHLLVGLLGMITVPSLLGMVVNDLTHGSLRNYSKSIGGFTSKIALFLVVYINASVIAPEIHWNHTVIKLLLVIFILSISGYSLGYIGSYVLKGHQRERMVSIIYGVGMRNNSLGMVLALTYFPVSVALPITLAMLFQQPLAAFVSYLLKRFDSHELQTSKSCSFF